MNTGAEMAFDSTFGICLLNNTTALGIESREELFPPLNKRYLSVHSLQIMCHFEGDRPASENRK